MIGCDGTNRHIFYASTDPKVLHEQNIRHCKSVIATWRNPVIDANTLALRDTIAIRKDLSGLRNGYLLLAYGKGN